MIADVAEPGSTFKIVVVSGALNDGLVRLTDTFDCEHGHFHFAGRVLHDHESYGVLSVEQIITKSRTSAPPRSASRWASTGFTITSATSASARATGLPLPGRSGRDRASGEEWSKVSIAQIPMGQGIAVTRLQMMMAMCAIANKGVLMGPMLVDRLEDRDHNVVAQVFSAARAPGDQRSRGRADGDGPQDRGLARGHRAQSGAGALHRCGQDRHGAKVRGTAATCKGKYFASFIGFFPADNPEICIAVSHGRTGNKAITAAKLRRRCSSKSPSAAANYLNIRPEDGEAAPAPRPVAPSLDDRTVKTASARSQ